MATKNERKFLKLLYLYDSNRAAFHAYIAKLTSLPPSYAKFGSDTEATVINAIEGYKLYNEFMDIIQYFPNPDFTGFKINGGKQKSKRCRKLCGKRTKRSRR
jgi:hypothetical protein